MESDSIYVIREAYHRYSRLAMLWSMGKDSTALLWMVRKAFFGKVPFPVIHIDTSYKFPEIYAFRDRLAKELDLDLRVARNEEALAGGLGPDKTDKFACCNALKTNALKQAIAAYLRALPVPPIFAVLFGSTAKGTYRDASDIDLLLVTHERLETEDAEKEASALHAVRISAFQLRYADFIKEVKLKDDPVVQSAIASGYPLVNHVAYYEAVRHERVGS